MPTRKGSKTWNSGTSKGWTDKRGYRWLYVDENGKRVARREHRVVMERHLSRRLEPWELVHHKDGNPVNNCIDNLELTTFGDHASCHHLGTRRDADARRSMEAFGLMREEMKRVRVISADLLALLQEAMLPYGPYDMAVSKTKGEHKNSLLEWGDKARALIAKVTGATS